MTMVQTVLLTTTALALFTACTQPLASDNGAVEASVSSDGPPAVSLVITEDIPRFWEAYDRIVATDDAGEQLALLNALYIDRGTAGLHAMNRARSYRTSEYLQAINDYPEFWQAVRSGTLDVEQHSAAIEAGLLKLKALYSAPRDVPVYFVIGALRAGGTATDGKMLIGAELAMADASVPSHEFSDHLSHLGGYFANNPVETLVDLNLHEYIHAVQTSTGGIDLLSQALFEGVAEYLSTETIGRKSAQPAILYGVQNHEAVFDAFIRDIDSPQFDRWIWNGDNNAFGQSDLGYYVGYAMAEGYLAQASDKRAAIAKLIEMDYSNVDEVARIVDSSGAFEETVAVLRERHAAE